MLVLTVIAAALGLAAVVLAAVAWRVGQKERHRYYSNRAGTYGITSVACLFAMIIFGVAALVSNDDRRYRSEAKTLLGKAVAAEAQFHAAHGHYGTLDVDLALNDSTLLRALDRHHKLVIELSADAQTAKITAKVGRERASRFIGRGARTGMVG